MLALVIHKGANFNWAKWKEVEKKTLAIRAQQKTETVVCSQKYFKKSSRSKKCALTFVCQ